MTREITNDVLEAFLHCRLKGHLKRAGERGEASDYELMLSGARARIRDAAAARLLARHTGTEIPRGVVLDAGLLARGSPLLLDASLEDNEMSFHLDALLRVNGESRLGGFHYVPILFHETERPTRELRTLLAIHGLVLGTAQGREPAVGIIIHGRACKSRRIMLGGVRDQARRLLREFRESQANLLPKLVLNKHCQVCEFRKRCHAEATIKDDLSLLRGMGEMELRKYAKRGIFTVTQLSCTFRPPRRMNKPGHRKLSHSHALQALAVRERKVHILGTPELPTASTRIYLDIEGDPERSFCYLLGVVVRAGDTEERYSFWIDSPAEEAVLLGRFLDLVALHPEAWVYVYGRYEAAFLRRAGKVAGRDHDVERLLARTFNVLSTVYLHVYFPVHSNSLKDVAGQLGFRWTEPKASGVLSVVWRREWEESQSPAMKEKLVTYNLDDCDALWRVTEFLYEVCPGPADGRRPEPLTDLPITRVEEMDPVSCRRDWCRADFAVPDFGFINERAYYDYQRNRVYVRTSKTIRRSQVKQKARKGTRNRANRMVELIAEKCPFCGSGDLSRIRSGRLARLAFDLRTTRSGIRRWVTRYTTSYHCCTGCGKQFLPWEYLRLDPHCHSLKSWAMNQHVVHRTTLANVAEMIKENFGLPVFYPDVRTFKVLLAGRYEGTYKRLMEKLVAGNLIHADETEVHLKHGGKGYVWVFTNLEEVVFMYKPSREGTFLHDLLKDFRGVLVTDFYAAYDSLNCPQQKCLIHLIRDFNQDIQGNPWDEELKSLAVDFGNLLRAVVATIDQHGLKQRHLSKHRRDVERFFKSLDGLVLRSEVAEGYRKRLLKCQGRLFTFLDYDGVPWNNNNAEHAVKRFAYYREVADGLLTEAGLNQYLVLLSTYLTCKYKGVSFLKFLLSQETDIDQFCQSPGRKRPILGVELQPEGYLSPRRRRKQDWGQGTQGVD
jgi:predicted RecB family nuclease